MIAQCKAGFNRPSIKITGEQVFDWRVNEMNQFIFILPQCHVDENTGEQFIIESIF